MAIKLSITLLAKQTDHMNAIAHNPPTAMRKEWEEKEFLDQWRFQNRLLLFSNLATLNFHTLSSILFSRHTYFLPLLKALLALKTHWLCLANRTMNEKMYWDRREYHLWGKRRHSVKFKLLGSMKLDFRLQELFPRNYVQLCLLPCEDISKILSCWR
jgi:hypothetical protein